MHLLKLVYVGLIWLQATRGLEEILGDPNSQDQISTNSTGSKNINPNKLKSKSNILVALGFGSRSHIKPLLEVSKVLESRGHSITYASIDDFKKFNEGYDFPFLNLGGKGSNKELIRKDFEKFAYKKRLDQIKVIADSFPFIFEENYKISFPRLDKYVKENRPDLMMCDFFAQACKDVADMNSIPLVIGVQVTDIFGIVSSNYITNTIEYAPTTTDQMTFFQRLYDGIFIPLKRKYYFYPFMSKINSARATFGVPPSNNIFGEFKKNLILANTFEGFEVSSPLQPNLKMVGPLISEKLEPMNQGLDVFLAKHKSVIYIAFGSQFVLAKFDIENLMIGLLKALKNGSIDGVIWGLANTKPSDFPEYIEFNGEQVSTSPLFDQDHPSFRLLSWAPQPAILNHPNVKLFISHGGLDSTMEAIYSGTTILSMGVFGDQLRNAKKLENLGVGFFIDRITTTPDLISELITKTIEDKDGHIKANVQRLKIMAHAGSKRRGLAANYVEEYIQIAKVCRTIKPYKYGEIPCEIEHLAPIGQHMSFVTTNKFDLYLVAFIILLATLSISVFSFKILFSLAIFRFFLNLPISKKDQ